MTTTVNGSRPAAVRTESVAGGEVAFLSEGQGRAMLVVHHEIGTPGWLPFYDALAASHKLIVPDLPGYGASSRPEWARHPRDLAIVLHLLLDQIGVDSTDLVGFGFGGWVAAEMATMNQGRLGRLVLVNPYGLQPREGEILDQFIMGHEDFVRAGFRDRDAFGKAFGAIPSVDQLETWDVHRETTTRIAWKPYMFNSALPALLQSVRTPTLVVAGTEDRIAPPDCARRYVECLPSATLQLIQGAGHFAEMERPDELARAIGVFCRKEA